MISRLKGTLVERDLDRVEIETPGGVVYEVGVPKTILERLPARGAEIELRTFQVVREDALELYGFVEAVERELFSRLLGARGVGPALAAGMLSTYSASRLARILAEKDTEALRQVSGVGRKTAERIVIDLSDKVQDLAVAPAPGEEKGTAAAREAVSALVSLGYSFAKADEAVRKVLEDGGAGSTSEELIRRALAED